MAKNSESFEKVSSFQKEALDALMEAATTSGKGFEKLQAEIAAYAKSSGEAFAEATKAIFGAKSLEAALEAQQSYAKSAFEAHMGELTKLSEMMTDSMKAAFQPLSSQAKAFAGAFEFKAA